MILFRQIIEFIKILKSLKNLISECLNTERNMV
jgi:hypothetical protein